tara:strand:+ start:912 stop:1241 length:330 start_codon:yes stop_codon:yes gene_type:complete
MKKFILFPSYLLIIGLLAINCYNKPKQTTSAMIVLKDVHENSTTSDCNDCYEKIYKIVDNSTRGIKDIDITQSEDKSTILILIEYDHNVGNLNEIKNDLVLEGYNVDSD